MFCFNCGKKIDENVNFCPNCGKCLKVLDGYLNEQNNSVEQVKNENESVIKIDKEDTVEIIEENVTNLEINNEDQLNEEIKNTEVVLENKEDPPVKEYSALQIVLIISWIFSACLTPITLIWTIPMSIYVFIQVSSRKKIGGFVKFLSWILISPLVGILLCGYNEQ